MNSNASIIKSSHTFNKTLFCIINKTRQTVHSTVTTGKAAKKKKNLLNSKMVNRWKMS